MVEIDASSLERSRHNARGVCQMNTSKSTIGGPGTTPEDILAAAGLPHGSTTEHSLHDRLHKDTAAGLHRARAETADAVDDARDTAEGLKSRAAHLAEQASDTFDEAKERVYSAASDAKGRAAETARDLRDRAGRTYDETRDWASEQSEAQRRRLSDLSDRGAERLREGKSAVETFVSENPLLVGVVGVAAGLLLGALLPRTRKEDETVGPWADEVRDQGLRYARDITSKGREFVESALDPEAINAAAQRVAEAAEPNAGANRPRPH
ncbi:hypothetical protein [Methylobacterium sp. Leaf466]|uniref:hypothetical protein n=1 Tax=Methylobacterium sp. Leaf466 TaxID=1736386 RepID=UPI001FCD9044|nr:hypothetical protein [Methylobacterium sp. Leaf466]